MNNCNNVKNHLNMFRVVVQLWIEDFASAFFSCPHHFNESEKCQKNNMVFSGAFFA